MCMHSHVPSVVEDNNRAKPHCTDSMALPFEMVFKLSHNLGSVKQVTRIGHMWRIIIGHNALVTNHLLIYNKHMLHEND